MAGNIKGITVEIDGDTSQLSKAINDVNKRGKELSTELKEVDKLLKFDPSNTVALAQKQKILGESVENVSEKLEKLRSVQDQVEQQYKSGNLGEDKYRAFQRELLKTESYLDNLKNKQKEMSDIDIKVDDSEIKKADKAVDELGDSTESAGSRGSKALGALGVAVGATAGAIFGLVEGTKELNMDLARLEANAMESGKSMEGISKEFQQIASLSGETDSAVETMSNLLQTNFEGENLSKVVDNISGAVIRFSDTLNSEGIADGLQETLASGEAIGQFGELLTRSGVDLEKFNAGLVTAKQNGTETDYVLQQLSALGLTDTYEAYKKSNGAVLEYNETQVALQMALAGLGERLMPLVTMVMQLGVAFVEWTNKVFDSVSALDLFSSGISASLPQMIEAGMNALQNFIQGITDNLPQMTATALAVIQTWLDNMATLYPMLIEAGVQIIGALVQGIAQNLPIIVQGITGVITALVETVVMLLPQIIEMGANILTSLIDGIVQMLPSLIDTALQLIVTIIETVVSSLPQIVESGVKVLNSLVDGILQVLPLLIPTAVKIITTLVQTVTENLPKIIESGVKLLNSLISGITQILPKLVSTAIDLVLTIAKTILQNLPEILGAGIKIIGKLIEGLINSIPDIIVAIAKIIKNMADKFVETDWSKIGKDIIKGLISGISSMAGDAVDAIAGVVGGVVEKAKSLLKTASPSRLFRDEIGKMIPAGLAIGIETGAPSVLKATEDMVGLTIPQIDSRVVSGVGINNNTRSQEVVIMLDSEVIGRQVFDVVGEQIVVMAGGRF